MVNPKLLMKDEFKCVRERQMADVVQESRAFDQPGLIRVHLKGATNLHGNPEGPEGMFEPCVIRTGEHEIREAQLVNAVQPLQLGGLQ